MKSTRAKLALMLGLGFLFLFVALQTTSYLLQDIFFAAATAIVLIAPRINWIGGDVKFFRPTSLKELGLGKPNWHNFCLIVAISAFCAAMMVTMANVFGTLHWPKNPRHGFLLGTIIYAALALFQEFAAQTFFFRRCEIIFRNSIVALAVTAAIFSAMHWQNYTLMAVTFFFGLAMTNIYRKQRNLWAIWVSHVMLALAFSISMPEWLTQSMRVGSALVRWKNHVR